jgi:hypothetical protein
LITFFYRSGVTLSYILLVQQVWFTEESCLSSSLRPLSQAFGWMVRQSAEVENDMNGVERILHYANEVEQEAPHELPDQKPNAAWPVGFAAL